MSCRVAWIPRWPNLLCVLSRTARRRDLGHNTRTLSDSTRHNTPWSTCIRFLLDHKPSETSAGLSWFSRELRNVYNSLSSSWAWRNNSIANKDLTDCRANAREKASAPRFSFPGLYALLKLYSDNSVRHLISLLFLHVDFTEPQKRNESARWSVYKTIGRPSKNCLNLLAQ